jgi:protein-S-isoprenylcysteine O-methyltransferase Ste14
MSEPPTGPAAIALRDERRLLKQRTRRTRWLVWALVPFVAICAPLTTAPWVLVPLKMLGLLCLIACMVGRAWSALYIGERKRYELISVGPFSIVRNPLYVSSFIGTIGAAMQSGMFTLLAVAVLAFVAYHRVTVAREEEFLRERHGPAYDAYVRSVPRWWPKLSGWRDVPRVSAAPSLVLKYLGESSFFFLSFFFFEAIRALQGAGIVPVLLLLP